MAADPWRCERCGKHYVIPPLARDCERRHEREAISTGVEIDAQDGFTRPVE